MCKYLLLAAVIIIANSCRTPGNSSGDVNRIETDHFSIDLPGKYSLDKVQGKDGVIYHIESSADGAVKKHGEIFLGFHPGTVEQYYDDSSKTETRTVEILDGKRDLGIYFEKNEYSTIAILPLKNSDGFESYVRIIGIEESAEKLYGLMDSFSTLFLH
jgi:hypothetical protein